MSNDQHLIELTGLHIWDSQGVERLELSGSHTPEQLANALLDAWIPYFECRQCGRWDYCKYPRQHSVHPNCIIDIQCGVARDAIHSLVKRTFDLLREASAEGRQEWLDGAFHFAQFVYHSELQIGNFLSEAILDWWSTYAPLTFGQLVGLRKHLDGIARHFRCFPQFRSEESVLFVEGWSEKAFLDRLKESRLASFLFLQVGVYGGKGNRRPKRIQMLLDKYRDRGYQLFVQGDSDGSSTDVLQALIKQCSIPEDHTFVFQHDFETSIPPDLLLFALQVLGELEEVAIDEFQKVLEGRNTSVRTILQEIYRLDLDPIKIDLAELVADILNDSWKNQRSDDKFVSWSHWWANDEFIQAELGRFLEFVQKI